MLYLCILSALFKYTAVSKRHIATPTNDPLWLFPSELKTTQLDVKSKTGTTSSPKRLEFPD